MRDAERRSVFCNAVMGLDKSEKLWYNMSMTKTLAPRWAYDAKIVDMKGNVHLLQSSVFAHSQEEATERITARVLNQGAVSIISISLAQYEGK